MAAPITTAGPPATSARRAPVRPAWWRRIPLGLWALLAGALLLRLGIALRDLDTVDALFVPDDTYYTLSIARSMAEGIGPSADGVTLTNGFQPLIAFLLVPVFLLSSDPDVGVRAALVLLAVVDVAVAALLGRLAYRLGGWTAGVIAVALWAVSPVAIGNALNGLETSLALLCQLATVELWWRARDTSQWRAAALAGVAAGLALLARVDSAFLIFLLGLMEIDRGSGRRLLAMAGAAALVVAPWWLYSLAQFGTVVPQSGAAVQEIVGVHRSIYLDLPEQLAWGAGSVIGAPFTTLPWLRELLFDRPVMAVLFWLGVLAALAYAIRRLGATREENVPLLALFLHGAAVFVFYSVVVSALWFFARYLAPMQAVATLLTAVAGTAMWRTAGRRGRWRAPAFGGLAVLGLLAAVALVLSVSFLVQTPAGSRVEGLHGANAYRQAAKQILAMAPDGAVIGSLQSGALGYYAGDRVRVVNLDGVVDREAAEALRDRRLADFARRRGVTHLADWRFNVNLFLERSGDPSITRERLRRIGTARPQGPNDAFALMEIPGS